MEVARVVLEECPDALFNTDVFFAQGMNENSPFFILFSVEITTVSVFLRVWDIEASYSRFIHRLPAPDTSIRNGDEKNLQEIIKSISSLFYLSYFIFVLNKDVELGLFLTDWYRSCYISPNVIFEVVWILIFSSTA